MSRVRDYYELSLKAFRSQNAIKALPIVITSPLSILSAPLVEVPDSGIFLAAALWASLLSQIFALLVVYLLWLVTYRIRQQPPLVLVIIAMAGGSTKALSMDLIVGFDNLEIDNSAAVLTRVISSSIIWSITFALIAIVNYQLLAIDLKWRSLAQELASMDGELISSQQQLDWLIRRRVDGLDVELRDGFLNLISDLRRRGVSAENTYLELGAKLKEFSKQVVRATSHDLWRKPVKKFDPLARAANQAVTANPFPAVLGTTLFMVGYLFNEFRIRGAESNLLLAFFAAVTLFFGLLIVQTLARYGLNRTIGLALITLTQGLVSGLGVANFNPEASLRLSIVTGTATSSWALLAIWAAGWLVIAQQLYQSELTHMQERGLRDKEKLEWLDIRLDAANREIAKYLHGVIQSRLMAHAISLENQSKTGRVNNIEEAIQGISEILNAPMSGFSLNSGSLDAELSDLIEKWSIVLKIKLEHKNPLREKAVIPTLQLIQEALSNSRSHGKATKVTIRIKDQQNQRTIQVWDNGVVLNNKTKGLGLEIYESITQGNYRLIRQNGQTLLEGVIPILSDELA
jgi:two-component sensor histidine kinase